MSKSLNVEEEWTLEFHGTTYLITILVNEMTLTLELENIQTTQRWSGIFTAEYILDTTQKAGNVKEFPVFIHLLKSSLNGGDETAIIDILTSTDLEVLKAQKLSEKGVDPSKSYHRTESRDKRYVILTYRTALDKVHYPISLSIEDTPNVPALRRTIRNLRAKVDKLEGAEPQFNSDIERDMRQTMGRLRQENEELRHRLRQSESRNNKAVNQSLNMSFNNGNNPVVGNNELVNVNAKLMRKVEKQKSELTALSVEHEKLKRKYEVDIAKLKQKIGIPSLSVQAHSESQTQSELMNVIKVLRNRLIQTERELRTLKLSVGQPVTRNRSELAKGYAPVSHSRGTAVQDNRRSRSLSAGRTQNTTINNSNWNNVSNLNSSRLTYTTNVSRYNAHNLPLSGDKREAAAELAYGRQRQVTPTNSRHSSPMLVRHTPTHPHSPAVTSSSRTPPRGRYASPTSSSLGGRFDPTAYHQNKSQLHKDKESPKAWGAGAGSSAGKSVSRYGERSPSPSYRESGYASGGSQSSRGSRQSKGYSSDSSAGSRHSDVSASRKKKKATKSSTKKTTKTTTTTSTSRSGSAAAPKKGQPEYYINSGGMLSEDEEILERNLSHIKKLKEKHVHKHNQHRSSSSGRIVELVHQAAADIEENDDLNDDLFVKLDQFRQAVSASQKSSGGATPTAQRQPQHLDQYSGDVVRGSVESMSGFRRSTERPIQPSQAAHPRSRSNSADSSVVSDISHSVAVQQNTIPLRQHRESFDSTGKDQLRNTDKLARLKRINEVVKQNLSAISVDSSMMKDTMLSFKENISVPRNSVRASDNMNTLRSSYDSVGSVSSTQSNRSAQKREMNAIDQRIAGIQSLLDEQGKFLASVK